MVPDMIIDPGMNPAQPIEQPLIVLSQRRTDLTDVFLDVPLILLNAINGIPQGRPAIRDDFLAHCADGPNQPDKPGKDRYADGDECAYFADRQGGRVY